MMLPRSFEWWALLMITSVISVGCGTTRTSNTQRTATEQLLISDAIDRTVQNLDFSKLAGQSIFFDERHLYASIDDGYLISSFRQHLLASGCILKENREEATFVVEPRAGAIGTDNDDLLFGIPAVNLPQVTMLAGLPSAVPEIPFVKRRHQRGVAKLAVFAYRRDTGEPAWQSGITTNESTSNDIWFFGAGPFKRGTIHTDTSYADQKHIKPDGRGPTAEPNSQVVGIGQAAVFSGRVGPNTTAQQVPQLASVPARPIVAAETVPPDSKGPEIFPPPQNSN